MIGVRRSLNLLLPCYGGYVATAAASLLGVPHAACVSSALLSSTSPPTAYDARSGVRERWVAYSHSTPCGVSRMANIYGQLRASQHHQFDKKTKIMKTYDNNVTKYLSIN